MENKLAELFGDKRPNYLLYFRDVRLIVNDKILFKNDDTFTKNLFIISFTWWLTNDKKQVVFFVYRPKLA